MSNISDKAVVSPKAKIGENVTIYPFVYIEDNVEIGDNSIIYPNVSILNGTKMGSNNKVHQGTVLGAMPQDFNFRGEPSQLIIGNDNIFRENVVINRATHSTGQTVIGDNNFFMEGAHISHDTKVGKYCVFGYGTKIAGDCEISNGVIFSTSAICNPHVRVGECAMISANVSKDVPPYIIANGNPVKYGGVNTAMLNIRGIDESVKRHIANAYRLVFHGQSSIFDAVLQIKEQIPDAPEIREIIQFIEATKIGIITKL